MAREPVYVNADVSCSLAYNDADVMNSDNVTTVLSAHIKISITLIGMVRKPLVVPIVLAR